jgi:uncharacterized RmlC-like cupin family protein
MSDEAPVRRVRPTERTEGEPTPGMTREQAVTTDKVWAGFVRTDAGMVSGWHHHGEYETSICVISGALRMECGPGGAEVVDAALVTSCTSRLTRSIEKATRWTKNRRWSWCVQGRATP